MDMSPNFPTKKLYKVHPVVHMVIKQKITPQRE